MTTRTIYALVALAVLVVEILIALFVMDDVVRPYGGDTLAVVLVYAALRAATSLRVAPALIATLSIAAAVELSQAFDIVGKLGLGRNQLARILLGGSFDALDLAAYAVGALLVLAAEAMRARLNSP